MTKLLLAATSSLGLLAIPAAAQHIIVPTNFVIDAGGPGFGSLTDTINQNGLSAFYTPGVTNFDAFLATNPTHTLLFSGNEWFSNQPTSSATVTYDFGSVVGIDRLALWNEEAAGIGRLNLLSSSDGVTFSSLGMFSPTDNPSNSNYLADVFSFASAGARYVRFEMTECPQPDGSFNSCSIGEVAFRSAILGGAVPEPATWAFMIFGFGAIGGAMRRQRKTNVRVRYA